MGIPLAADMPHREAFENTITGRVVAIYGDKTSPKMRIVIETDEREMRALERNAFGRACQVTLGK